MSQFHYGSIQMAQQPAGMTKSGKSQFHYGSIQIYIKTIKELKALLCLNSTMVRFKFT